MVFCSNAFPLTDGHTEALPSLPPHAAGCTQIPDDFPPLSPSPSVTGLISPGAPAVGLGSKVLGSPVSSDWGQEVPFFEPQFLNLYMEYNTLK